MSAFDDQPSLVEGAVRLDPLTAEDRDALFTAASDPKIWEVHPSHDRWQREVFDPYFDFLLSSGGTLVIRDRAEGRVIGCSRYYPPNEDPQGIGIGYTFLVRSHWGGATNFAIKTAMLDHAFKHFDTVWFHIGPENIRSQKATAKLGTVFVGDSFEKLGEVTEPWKCYTLSRADWQRVRAERLAEAGG